MNSGFDDAVFDTSFLDIIDSITGIYANIKTVLETVKVSMPQTGYRGSGLSVSVTLENRPVMLKLIVIDHKE